MAVQVTLEIRCAHHGGEWTRLDPSDRADWQWHDSPDWLASEALWRLGEGDEVRLVSTGIDTGVHPNLKAEEFGDFSEGGSLSLNPPDDNPRVPADAHWFSEPDPRAGQVNEWHSAQLACRHPASEVTKLRGRVRDATGSACPCS